MGFFDEKKEYVIEDMYPKRPWMNYLWNEEYIAVINQFGFGKGRFSSENNFQRDIVKDCDSRIIYLKFDDEIIAVNRNYLEKAFNRFETVVGLGYSAVISEYKGLQSNFTILVPQKGKRECWRLVIKNTTNQVKHFDLYAFVDLDARITEHLSCTYGDFQPELNGVYFRHNAYGSPTEYHVVHFATDLAVEAYETARRRFVGVYGNLLTPDGIKADALSSTDNSFDAETIAALQSKIVLEAGQEKTFYFTVGVERSLDDAIEQSKEVLQQGGFEKELDILDQQARKYDARSYLKTPDMEVDRFANIWLKRQMELGKTWGRVYNKGFRDIMQDISGFVQLDAETSQKRLLDTIQFQKEDGNTLRSWVPLDLHNYRDGAVWLLSTVTAYLKETADVDFLNEKVGYFESALKETVFDHCIRGVEFLHREVGEHGLCLWGGGDWNDSFDGAGLQMVGESVWLSIATIKGTKDFLELLNWLRRNEKDVAQRRQIAELISKYTKKNEILTNRVQQYGWDKDHYIYGINDWHERVGSYDTPTGQIFLNPQTWAVLAGIAKDSNALLDFVEAELSCDFGYVQQKPCYKTPDPHLGRISYFGNGFYENGSVYNHGVAFKIVADCVAGRGNRAYETLKKLFPSNPANDFTKSGVEPYALCNMFFGPENETRGGEAPMHWITGTSSWAFRGITEYLLGVRADFDGLLVDPQIPDAWNEAKMTRSFRNAVYEIDIRRSPKTGMMIDGKPVPKGIVPAFDDGKTHHVVVFV